MLGDQALPAVQAGLREELLAVAVTVRREPERVTEIDSVLEHRLTLPQRQRSGVPAVREQHVEHVVVHRHLPEQRLLRVSLAEPLLQPPEPRLLPVERDDLPVYDQLTVAVFVQSAGDLREGAGDVVLAAALPRPAAWPSAAAAAIKISLLPVFT